MGDYGLGMWGGMAELKEVVTRLGAAALLSGILGLERELRNKPLVIRNPVDGNFVETGQKVASVKEALLDIARTKPDMAIALDCKEQTAEAAFDLLKNEPELRKFTALKLYAKAYPGGFDQFLGNLYERYNIDPKHPEDRAKRQELLQTLKGIKVALPVLKDVLDKRLD